MSFSTSTDASADAPLPSPSRESTALRAAREAAIANAHRSNPSGVALDCDQDTFRHEARRAAFTLLRTCFARGLETEAHCERVAAWSRRLAREVGLSSERVLDVELGAILHDLGYAGLRNIAFSHDGRLTAGELFELRRHPELGAARLREVAILRGAIPLVASHHERFDGTGYPRRYSGIEIPIDARIFHLVDAYDAITRERPYHGRLSDAEARVEIELAVGTQFDPFIHAAFARISPAEWVALGGDRQ